MFYATVHRFNTPYVESVANFTQTPLPFKSSKQRVTFDFHADYHVYGFLWSPTEMKWFVDGQEVFSRANDYYNTPLHIMFDCEIMESWAGLPDPADLPATFADDAGVVVAAVVMRVLVRPGVTVVPDKST